ncbi:alpha/beta hydrolase [Actinomadura luteofluorescens]|uniref:alpha/beta hydrolase n=1 Tax=Actinomadura luteofluorescens TaxID=46163 RepID=UPI00347DFBE4
MPLPPDVRRLVDRLAAEPPFTELGPVRARTAYAARIRDLIGEPDPAAPGLDREDTVLDGVPVRVYRPSGVTGPAPGVVFFHGGGWVIGDLDTHDAHARAVAAGLGAVVVSAGYRLAPEHPYPAALEDCWTVTRRVAGDPAAFGIDAGRLGVAGDSAGGNLAAAVALAARDADVRLRAQLLVYPVTDPTMSRPSYAEFAEGHYLTADAMRWFIDAYLPDPATRTLPGAGPLHAADLAGLAPALVVTAEYDPLRDEGAGYAARLREAGVAVREIAVPATVHGFLEFVEVVPEARAARDEIIRGYGRLLGA